MILSVAVFEEFTSGKTIGNVAILGEFQVVDLLDAMVEQEHVRISIAVIIEEGRLVAVGRVVKAIFPGGFPEFELTQIDKELIPSGIGSALAGVANINIKQAVLVHVGHGDAGLPVSGSSFQPHACRGGDVFEPEPAQVSVQFIGSHVCGEEQILESVVVQISHGKPSSIEEVFVGEHVEPLGFADGIDESDARLCAFQQRKQWGFLRLNRSHWSCQH